MRRSRNWDAGLFILSFVVMVFLIRSATAANPYYNLEISYAWVNENIYRVGPDYFTLEVGVSNNNISQGFYYSLFVTENGTFGRKLATGYGYVKARESVNVFTIPTATMRIYQESEGVYAVLVTLYELDSSGDWVSVDDKTVTFNATMTTIDDLQNSINNLAMGKSVLYVLSFAGLVVAVAALVLAYRARPK